MGRTRTIKPAFFRSKSLAGCSPLARLLFVGLWTEADDEGRGVAEPRILAAALFPWDAPSDEAVTAWLDELVATDHIVIYEARGTYYFAVKRFREHQSAAYRRGTSTLPEPPDNPPPHTSARTGVQESARQDKTGREGEENRQDVPPDSAPVDKSVVGQSLDLYARHLASLRTDIRNMPSWLTGTRDKARAERGTDLRAYLNMRPAATAEELACHVLGVPTGTPQSPRKDAWTADPDCAVCGGDGLANTADPGEPAIYGPCPCRQSSNVYDITRRTA